MITSRVSNEFNRGVRSRGAEYFRKGRVHISASDEKGRIVAVVQGSRLYTVTLDIKRKKRTWAVKADCTCPYVDSHDDFCKHIWATLLAVEEKRSNVLHRLGPVPNTVRMDLAYDDEFNNDFDDWDDDEEVGNDEAEVSGYEEVLRNAKRTIEETARILRFPSGGTAARKTRGRSPTKKKPVDRTPPWRKLLQQIPGRHDLSHDLPKTDDSPIDPIYVLDADVGGYSNGLVLSLAQQRLTASGKPGKTRKLSLSLRDIDRIRESHDRTICMMLLGADEDNVGYGYYAGYGYDLELAASRFLLTGPLQSELLPLISATGRFVMQAKAGAEPTPLMFDDSGGWELALLVERIEKSNKHMLRGVLRRNDERRPIDSVDCFLRGKPSLFVHDGTLRPFEDHDCFDWLTALQTRGPIPLSKGDLPKFLGDMSDLSAFPPIDCPADWNVIEINDLYPQPELSLRFEENNTYRRDAHAHGDVRFHYGDVAADAAAPGRFIVDTSGQRLIRRQPPSERRLLVRLLELGARVDRHRESFEVKDNKVPTLVCSLITEGWTVLGNRKLYRRPGQFRINVSSGIDWFDVDAQVDFDGQAAKLPELLAALNKNERFVRLGDGSFGMLPDEWLNRHKNWLSLGQPTNGKVRFSRTQIGLIDALLAEMPEATFDANLAATRRKLGQFAGIKPRKEPPGFSGTLRPYQREGLGWLRFLEDFDWGGCLADDMGLGKTVQLLALLADRRQQRRHGPSLIVAPKSVVFNWVREAERFAPRLRTLDYTGLSRKEARNALAQHDIVLTTYGTLRRDIRYLRELTFNYVVLDEAQAIKNPTSQSAKAARLLRARRRLALTGTPVENELGDLWSLFEFLNPGMLGTVDAFRSIARTGNNGGAPTADLSLLQRVLRPFILRRTKAQVATDLPERSEQTIECDLPPKQRSHYRELRDHYRESLLSRVEEVGLNRSKMHVLEALLRLRQAACHPGLVDSTMQDAESGKLEMLMTMVAELLEEGHKALIFSQFTKLLAIVRRALDQRGVTYEYLDGKTRDRDRRVDRFQNDSNCRLFLISLKAGGTGLNLTAADYILILDPWWNPAVEAQAIDRAHRIGQNKKVIAYRLIARDTIESKILDLQQSKRELSEAIITQQNSLVRTLTKDDLAMLLA